MEIEVIRIRYTVRFYTREYPLYVHTENFFSSMHVFYHLLVTFVLFKFTFIIRNFDWMEQWERKCVSVSVRERKKTSLIERLIWPTKELKATCFREHKLLQSMLFPLKCIIKRGSEKYFWKLRRENKQKRIFRRKCLAGLSSTIFLRWHKKCVQYIAIYVLKYGFNFNIKYRVV